MTLNKRNCGNRYTGPVTVNLQCEEQRAVGAPDGAMQLAPYIMVQYGAMIALSRPVPAAARPHTWPGIWCTYWKRSPRHNGATCTRLLRWYVLTGIHVELLYTCGRWAVSAWWFCTVKDLGMLTKKMVSPISFTCCHDSAQGLVLKYRKPVSLTTELNK